MPAKEFNCLATMIGSMPHTDPTEACAQITRYLKEIPAWPQLPKRSFLENMYVQYSEGFPGLILKEDKIYVDRSRPLDKQLEQLYTAYLENNVDKYPVKPDYASGLHKFLSLTYLTPVAVKGQIVGPVSFGLTVTDKDGKSIIYDETLSDAAAKLLKLRATWQERRLREICRDTIIFVDEPYMASFGSAFVSISKEKVTSLLEEVFNGISGLKGVHCCGNTDWPVLLKTSANIVSFDAYNHAQSLSLYAKEVKEFLHRSGTIAWGIVPNDEESLAKESVGSLRDRLGEAMAPFTRNGIQFKQLIAQGLLTPSCGLARLATGDAAGQALELLSKLSLEIRKRYL